MDDFISRKSAISAASRTDYRGLTIEEVTKVTDAVIEEIKRLPSAQLEHIANNKVHLCTSCQYTVETCCSHGNDALFGDGTGNDNICACNKYNPISVKGQAEDCISRKAAMKAVLKVVPNDEYFNEKIRNSIESLPSVQPEEYKKGCRNCRHGKYNDHWKTHFCYCPNECNKWDMWEPQAKGKWIFRNVEDFKGRPTGKHWCKCDQCGEEEILSYQRKPFKFCPNCGCRMESDD
mgnify:CR=1 FL=1